MKVLLTLLNSSGGIAELLPLGIEAAMAIKQALAATGAAYVAEVKTLDGVAIANADEALAIAAKWSSEHPQ